MEKLLNKFAVTVFNIMAARRQFYFRQVATPEDFADINRLCGELEPNQQPITYKKSTVNFIAYCNNIPVGMVHLCNPTSATRSADLYGPDGNFKYYDIQNLLVKNMDGASTQFIMLGLFKEMYSYSIKHFVLYWNANGCRNVYVTMRRYCQEIERIDIDFDSIRNPLTQYMATKKITGARVSMEVAAIEPWKILKKFVHNTIKSYATAAAIPSPLKIKTIRYATTH
jgi:hypothetical protein